MWQFIKLKQTVSQALQSAVHVHIEAYWNIVFSAQKGQNGI